MQRLITEHIGARHTNITHIANMVCGHAACAVNAQRYKGTRIEITGVVERRAAGEPIDTIVQGYRGRVSRKAIVEATQIVTTPA